MEVAYGSGGGDNGLDTLVYGAPGGSGGRGNTRGSCHPRKRSAFILWRLRLRLRHT